ncbi:MAG: hypothetical protein GX640_04210 [Fibrobacter sp.]|nr:hypothetical protein [Fibrobacter sp.]
MNSSLNNSKSIDEIIIDIKSTVIVGEYETSLIELESAIVQYPDSAVLWELKASVLFSINMYKEAINSAHIANGLDSGLIDSWIIKAKSLYMLHKYDESIDAAEKAIQIDSKCASAYLIKARSIMLSKMLRR